MKHRRVLLRFWITAKQHTDEVKWNGSKETYNIFLFNLRQSLSSLREVEVGSRYFFSVPNENYIEDITTQLTSNHELIKLMFTFHPDNRALHRNAYRVRCTVDRDHCNEPNSAGSMSTKAHLRLSDSRWCRRRCATSFPDVSARLDSRRAAHYGTSPYRSSRETCRSRRRAGTSAEFDWDTSLWRFDSSRGKSDTVSRRSHSTLRRTRAGSWAEVASRENRSCEESTRNR